MSAAGRFYDLDEGEVIKQAVLRANGDEIAFDVKHSDGFDYSVVLIRNNGSIFTGKAVSQPGSELAEVTCRVFTDTTDGTIFLFGSKWQQPGQPNYTWSAEIQIE